eukprot:TRINITY_DN19369_c0_g1_i1.p1 TRINITY_DN19369_c0_g1~~TRINITY_DN19369_c0_g1_i1.p1  ORF type:complete len:424 (+),score=97.39 TRINITY_DN19369_c0_g1_i1:83-1354(+)
MSGKQSESETDPDDAPNPAHASAAASEEELLAYSKSLGADMREPDMAWLIREAFESALPSSWSEHVDAEGRVYFHSQVTNESSWLHPMDEVYKQLISAIASIRMAAPAADFERRSQLVRNHLLEVHERALSQLAQWSGPYKSEAGQYYYNESMQLSTWFSPIEEWEYELAIRHSVLHRCLLAGHAPSCEEASPAGLLSSDDILEVPMLRLPSGLSRREEDQNSARSFYTARESSRSGCSARSLGGSEASPPARARKMSPTQPVSPVPEENRQGTHSTDAAGKASLESAFSDAASIQTTAAVPGGPGSQSQSDNTEEMDITFGCTSSLQMPMLPKKSFAAEAASEEGPGTVAEVKDDYKVVPAKEASVPTDVVVDETSQKPDVEDEEFDITFGASSPVKMPKVPTKPGAAEPPSDEKGGAKALA